jgi:HTH-type transcriptional regulator/antitoxin HigA
MTVTNGKATVVIEFMNTQKYGQLLMQTLPVVISNEAEYERMLAEVDRLMTKGIRGEQGAGPRLAPEEGRLLSLIRRVIEDYEEEHYPIPDSAPHEILQFIMEERGLRQRDLLPVFGSDGLVSDVVNGKRAISKDKAKKLAEFLKVSVELFL